MGSLDQLVSSPKSEADKLRDELVRLKRHNALWRKHRKHMNHITDCIEDGQYELAHELWSELSDEDQIILNLAKTKGGWLWPYERDIAVRGVDAPTGWDSWHDRISKETK